MAEFAGKPCRMRMKFSIAEVRFSVIANISRRSCYAEKFMISYQIRANAQEASVLADFVGANSVARTDICRVGASGDENSVREILSGQAGAQQETAVTRMQDGKVTQVDTATFAEHSRKCSICLALTMLRSVIALATAFEKYVGMHGMADAGTPMGGGGWERIAMGEEEGILRLHPIIFVWVQAKSGGLGRIKA
jgi:hypothetical protein